MSARNVNDVEVGRIVHKSSSLLDCGDEEGALRVVRDALRDCLASPTFLEYASWLFSKLGCNTEAVDCFFALAKLKRLSAAQCCSLSALLLNQDRLAEAKEFAREAVLQDAESAFYATHYGALLIRAGEFSEAVRVLTVARQKNLTNVGILQQLSLCCEHLGENELARDFARFACKCEPSNENITIYYSHLLIKNGETEEVAKLLESALARNMNHHFIYILLGGAYLSMRRFSEALVVLNAGIQKNGETPEILMQKGIVYCSLKQFDDAVLAFKKLMDIDPNNIPARKSCLAALTVSGRIREATALAASIIAIEPDNKALLKDFKWLLDQRADNPDTPDESILAYRYRTRSVMREFRKPPSAVLKQLRVISALVSREARTRFRHNRLNYVWVLFEPLAHIGLMIALINTFAHGPPPLGDSFAVFYFTGIVPYHLFTHTAGYLMSSIAGNRHLMLMPSITPFDVTCARALVELANGISVALLIILGFSVLGLAALPIDPLGVFGAFVLIWVAGFGMGMLNSVLSIMFHGWEKLWGAVASALYFASGTFYIPSMMPEWIRDILAWNPVLQGIELIRSCYFHEVVPPWLDSGYLAIVAGVLFCGGLATLQAARSRVLAA